MIVKARALRADTWSSLAAPVWADGLPKSLVSYARMARAGAEQRAGGWHADLDTAIRCLEAGGEAAVTAGDDPVPAVPGADG